MGQKASATAAPVIHRAEHVGSLLRPAAIHEARAKHQAGELTDAQLRAIEDQEIKKLVVKQRAAGIKSISDGEFRSVFKSISPTILFQFPIRGDDYAETFG